jgi:hypothetical protein
LNIRTLRTVLLIQSIEESDRGGEVLPLADREEATREAARRIPAAGVAQASQLSVEGERFVSRRAEDLLGRMRGRSPVVDHVLAIAQGSTWFPRAVLLLAVVLGVGLSFLEGRHGMSLLAYPLIGLAIWNAVAYAHWIMAGLSGRPRSPRRLSSRWYQRSIGRSVDALLKHSELFSVTLSSALKRFVSEWTGVARTLLSEKANGLLHFSALLVALGFVAGLYLRGVDAALPHWVHYSLLALIVIPRLLLALASTIKVARLSYRVALPRSLVDYAFRLIAEADSASMRG